MANSLRVSASISANDQPIAPFPYMSAKNRDQGVE